MFVKMLAIVCEHGRQRPISIKMYWHFLISFSHLLDTQLYFCLPVSQSAFSCWSISIRLGPLLFDQLQLSPDGHFLPSSGSTTFRSAILCWPLLLVKNPIPNRYFIYTQIVCHHLPYHKRLLWNMTLAVLFYLRTFCVTSFESVNIPALFFNEPIFFLEIFGYRELSLPKYVYKIAIIQCQCSFINIKSIFEKLIESFFSLPNLFHWSKISQLK